MYYNVQCMDKFMFYSVTCAIIGHRVAKMEQVPQQTTKTPKFNGRSVVRNGQGRTDLSLGKCSAL